MADAAVPAPARSNPANAPGAVVSNVPHRGVVAAQRAKAGRGDTLRMIESGQLDAAAAKPSVPAPAPKPAKAEPPAEPAADPNPKPDPEPDPVEDDGVEGDADPEAEPDDEGEAPAAAPDAEPDAETKRRIATIQAAERRAREKAARKEAEIDARVRRIETEWGPLVKEAQEFKALRDKAAKARSNPALLADVFRGLGFTDDHFEPTAQALYALSKAGQADPARKAQAERLLRDREEIERVDATQRRLDELEAKLSARDQQTELQRLQASYLDETIEAIAPAAAPIAAKALANIEAARALGTPEGKKKAAALTSKLRSKLWAITEEMTAELDGEVPELADVIARYEETRGAELDELGIPRPTATTTPKKNDQVAEKKNPARTLSNDLSTTRVPRPSQSGDEGRRNSRKETLRLLESGKLD